MGDDGRQIQNDELTEVGSLKFDFGLKDLLPQEDQVSTSGDHQIYNNGVNSQQITLYLFIQLQPKNLQMNCQTIQYDISQTRGKSSQWIALGKIESDKGDTENETQDWTEGIEIGSYGELPDDTKESAQKVTTPSPPEVNTFDPKFQNQDPLPFHSVQSEEIYLVQTKKSDSENLTYKANDNNASLHSQQFSPGKKNGH